MTIAQEIWAISGQESPTVSPRSHLIRLQYPQHPPNPQNKFPIPHYKAPSFRYSPTTFPNTKLGPFPHTTAILQ